MVGVKSGREVLEQNLSADPYRALARVKVARTASWKVACAGDN